MTDYAKHIETGNRWLSSRGDAIHAEMGDFVTSAIELMRAATPKSAEAEREHVAREICMARHDTDGSFTALSTAGVEALVLRERASARAEGYAQQEDAIRKCETAIAEEMCETSRLSVQLSAAQAEIATLKEVVEARDNYVDELKAEIARLRAEYDQDHKMLIDVAYALQAKLTERDAEIERLRRIDAQDHIDRDVTLQELERVSTKLTNLRAAAARAVTAQAQSRLWREKLLAAVAASRT